MRIRFLRRRLSVIAPRMTVRSHVPVGWKVAGAVAMIGASVACGLLLARAGIGWGGSGAGAVPPAPDPSIARLERDNAALRAERDRLAQAGRANDGSVPDSSLAIERATVRGLGEQIARLEADNARLKEDAAFFEAATADRAPAGASDAASGIAIRRFQVVRDPSAGTARYRLLLTQDSRATREFAGTLQLIVALLQDGKPATLVLSGNDSSAPGSPASVPGAAGPSFAVTFRSYKRIDGTFDVPPGAVLRSVQARIFEKGAVRVQQTVAPK